MTEPVSSGGPGESGQRLDKWLWFARLTKSRTVAAAEVTGGKIKVNRVTVTKPSHAIKSGDVITSRISKNIRVLRVVAPGTRRGPAPEARLLYEDLSPPPPERSEAARPRAWAERTPGSGRPTKRERRKIDAFNGEG
jgi:ribosome-associated heat shock protein Hsp15